MDVIDKENGASGFIKKENGDGEANGNEDKSLQGKIICLIEELFGDFNLHLDDFLKEQVLVDNGWIAIDTILRYARLSKLTRSAADVTDALKTSTSGLIELCEETGRIRRSPGKPLPDNTPQRALDIKNRTVYCKGYPADCMDIDIILEFLREDSTVEHAQMRCFRNEQGQLVFKGSVTATFATRKEAEKFMSQDVVKFYDYPISRKWRADWEVEKAAEDALLETKAAQDEVRKAKKTGGLGCRGEVNGDSKMNPLFCSVMNVVEEAKVAVNDDGVESATSEKRQGLPEPGNPA